MALIMPTLLRETKFTFDRRSARQILVFSLPIGLSTIPTTIVLSADRYFIAHLSTIHDLGVYTLAYKLGNVVQSFLVMPFMLAWGPFVFSKEHEDGAKETFRDIVKYFVMISLAIVVLISILQIDLIRILTSNMEYYAATRIVPFISYAFFFYGFSNVVRVAGINITGKTYYTMIIAIIGMCVNLVANYFFVLIFGADGAAYSLLLTFFVIAALSFSVSTKLYPIDYEIRKMFLFLVVSIIVVTISQTSDLDDSSYGLSFRMLLVFSFVFYLFQCGLSRQEKDRLKLTIATKFNSIISQRNSN